MRQLETRFANTILDGGFLIGVFSVGMAIYCFGSMDGGTATNTEPGYPPATATTVHAAQFVKAIKPETNPYKNDALLFGLSAAAVGTLSLAAACSAQKIDTAILVHRARRSMNSELLPPDK